MMLTLLTTVALAATLTVDVDTEALSGSVHVRLYDGRDGYPGKAPPQTAIRTLDLMSDRSVVFQDISAGTYAVVVFHDVDGDGSIATNWLGIPTEPVGVYLPPDTRLWGPPSFRRTSFEIQDDDRRIRVALVKP